MAVSRSMSSPGVDLNSAVNNLNRQALFSQRIEGMLDEQDGSLGGNRVRKGSQQRCSCPSGSGPRKVRQT